MCLNDCIKDSVWWQTFYASVFAFIYLFLFQIVECSTDFWIRIFQTIIFRFVLAIEMLTLMIN